MPAYQLRVRESINKLKRGNTGTGVKGCSDEDIVAIETKERVNLPDSYKLFLRLMGRSAEGFLPGDDLFYPGVLELTSEAKALLSETDSGEALTDRDFVFAGHHDYVYLYFDTTDGQDPAVYRYVEGDESADQVFESFSAWLTTTIDQETSGQ